MLPFIEAVLHHSNARLDSLQLMSHIWLQLSGKEGLLDEENQNQRQEYAMNNNDLHNGL